MPPTATSVIHNPYTNTTARVATIVAAQQQNRRTAAAEVTTPSPTSTSDASSADAVAGSATAQGQPPRTAAATTSESYAKATLANHRSGINLFNKLMSEEPSPYPITFQEMTEEDVDNDNLQFMLEEFARRIVKNPPCRANTEQTLAISTVTQYFSSVKSEFQARWPNHYCWRDPSWHSKTLTDLEKKMKRISVNDGNGAEQNNKPCVPIYRLNSNMLVRDNATPDLTMICGHLLSPNTGSFTNRVGCMEVRCYLLFTYLADARGGEVKFLR